MDPVTLQELSQPKVSSTEFYLLRPEDAEFWTYDYKVVYDKDGELKLEVCGDEVNIAGRKFSFHKRKLLRRNKTVRPVKSSITFTEDIFIRFEALNFNIIDVKNGNDYKEISKAIKLAKKSKRPSIIVCHTTIGKDSILEGTNKVHGKPLSNEDMKNIRNKYKIETEAFNIDNKLLLNLQSSINNRVGPIYKKWEEEYTEIKENENIGLNMMLNLLERNAFVIDFDDSKFKISNEYSEEDEEGRVHRGCHILRQTVLFRLRRTIVPPGSDWESGRQISEKSI